MTNKLMYIPNDETQNYPFCSFKISGWNVWPFNLMKVLKVLKSTNKKKLLLKLVICVINSSMSPPPKIFKLFVSIFFGYFFSCRGGRTLPKVDKKNLPGPIRSFVVKDSHWQESSYFYTFTRGPAFLFEGVELPSRNL